MRIYEYIKSKEKFKLMPFVTIYAAIMELINDGYISSTAFDDGRFENVEVSQPKSER